MCAELVIVTTTYLSGVLLASTVGFRRIGRVAFGFLIGLFAFVTIGFLQVVMGLPTSPLWTLAGLVLVSALFWLWNPVLDDRPPLELSWTLSALFLIGCVVVFCYVSNPVKYHIDTFRYLLSSWLLADGSYQELASVNLLTKRSLTVPILHAAGKLYGEGYVRSLTPLMSFSLVAGLVWFYASGTKLMTARAHRYIVGALLVLLIVSNNRYVFNSFYVNGHLFFAACFVVIAASGWLLATEREAPRAALLGLVVIALPALIVTRPEAPLAALLALAPLLLSPSVSWRDRALALGIYGISTTLWHGYIVMAYLDQSSGAPVSATGPLILGVASVAAMPLLLWTSLTQMSRVLLLVAEGAVWLALIVLAARDPTILVKSLSATYENLVLGAGGWGLSVVLLSALVLAAIILCHEKSLIYLRFPLTTSIPLFLLLAYFREIPYRVGHGDSLNRMLIQIVPLAVLFIAVAATSERWVIPGRISGWIGWFGARSRTAVQP
jgi:hypothetical protein